MLSVVNDWQLGVLFLALYLAFVFPAMPAVGDAADYAASIRQDDFGVRTVHIGYNIFVLPFIWVGRSLGQSTTTILNVVAAFCMAGSIVVLHQLYLLLGARRLTSALACIVFGTTGIIWYHAEFGEVQALLIFLVIASIYLFLRGCSVAAGSLFAFTLLVSQAAIPTAVCFPAVALWKRSWKNFIKFSVTSSLVFVVSVAPIAQDYFFGPRGVIPSMGYYPSGSLLVTVAYFFYRLLENHTIWTACFVVGLVVSYKEMQHVFLATVVLWASHVWLNMRLSHVEYGFGWMPFYVISSLLIAMGYEWVYKKYLSRLEWGEVVLPLCIIVSATLSCTLYVWPKRMDAVFLQNVVRDVRKIIGNATVIATPHVGFVYVYETDPAVADVWTSSWKPLPENAASWETEMAKEHPLRLLLYRQHTHLFRRVIVDGPGGLILSESKRDQYREEGAVISEAEVRASLPSDFCLRDIASWANARLYEISSTDSCQSLSRLAP
jgi:hypothetical protein